MDLKIGLTMVKDDIVNVLLIGLMLACLAMPVYDLDELNGSQEEN